MEDKQKRLLVMLNPKKPSNYAYFDPISRLHLTLKKKQDGIAVMNQNVYNALVNGTLVPLNFSVNTETKEIIFVGNKKPEPRKQESIKPFKEDEKPKDAEQEEQDDKEDVENDDGEEDVEENNGNGEEDTNKQDEKPSVDNVDKSVDNSQPKLTVKQVAEKLAAMSPEDKEKELTAMTPDQKKKVETALKKLLK